MIRLVLAAVVLLLPFTARAQTTQQTLVDRATLSAQEMLNDEDGTDAQALLRRARATMICPRVFRAGFLIGGEGGGCVLVARDGAGSWSAPAFYGMGSGSVGFQIGIQDASVMMMILTEKGLRAVMDSQFKIGADATVAFVTLGGGVEGSTTAAFNADIVAFARTRGLFAGVSLSGSLMGSRSEWNRAYYGREIAPQQIVIQMEANNPGADPLREVLTRYGGPGPQASAGPAPALPPSRAQPLPLSPPPSRAPVQQQQLAPPRR